jgi:pimeloyl-ACP methyl ester carboxylesterase
MTMGLLAGCRYACRLRSANSVGLAPKYRVIAPDLPGFGFTEVPEGFQYTFDALAGVISEFLEVLSIKKYSVFIFDYGSPVGLRLALKNPDVV